jgi:hypothetical protein
MTSYHPDNLKLQPYGHAKVIELAKLAERLGVQFKINGIPFGASYDRQLWDEFEKTEFGARSGVMAAPGPVPVDVPAPDAASGKIIFGKPEGE